MIIESLRIESLRGASYPQNRAKEIDDEKTKNANFRNGMECFERFIALTSLGVGGSGIVYELAKTTLMLSYIPTPSISESLGVANLICLAPLVIVGIATTYSLCQK